MPQLKKSSVNRSGVTARYWTYETSAISYTVTKDLKLRFSIASKGGGKTDIQLTIAPEDIRSIVTNVASAFPVELAATLTQAAHTAVLGILADKTCDA